MKILVINGPNLNMLGKREPEIYGNTTLEDIENELKKLAQNLGLEIECLQSNYEGDLITWIQKSKENNIDGIILNAGAYTHTSIAIHDSIKSVSTPVIEVHLSNIYAREEFRHFSYISSVAKGQISGLGIDSYLLALRAIYNILIKKISGVSH
ncbi:MAG: type II 3-dehydroquinate dehydratase [Candidatus Sericytochromatia bacterium]